MISIITTVKNGADYIYEMLESVKNQTFQDFEHIVIDDASTDNTLQILNKFKKENPNFKMTVLEPGYLGRGKALNFGVSKANFDWIAIIDADDIWHPRKLEIQYNIINGLAVDVLATETLLFNSDSEINFLEVKSSERVDYYTLKDLLKSNMLSHSSILIKKALCNYDESRKSQFDYELWLRLAEAQRVLAKCSLPLNYHRIHNRQSFEAKMKKAYRWRAYKLKVFSAWRNKEFSSLIYSTGKFIFDMLVPRKIRFLIKGKLKKK